MSNRGGCVQLMVVYAASLYSSPAANCKEASDSVAVFNPSVTLPSPTLSRATATVEGTPAAA